jgi:hypothetical protein
VLRNFKDALDSHRQRVLAEEPRSDTMSSMVGLQ